jgi:hypothetical protein
MSIEAKQATPHNTLIEELMDSRIPKTEREHAAAREIERLREAIKQAEQPWVKTYAGGKPNFTAPPQRKPLTDEEIKAVYGNDLNYRDGDYLRFARAIEAKLKEQS